jgi:hypothetical protein
VAPTTGAGATVVCDLASPLAPGDDEQVTVEGFFTSAAAGGFSATADSATPDPQPVNDTATLNTRATQCADRADNDADSGIDFGTDNPDHGCSSVNDDTEAPNPQCSDGIDNDGDGGIDFGNLSGPSDFGCTSKTDDSEDPNPQCSNGTDDDGDTKIDMADPGCGHPTDDSESPDPPPEADFRASDNQFLLDSGVYVYRLDVKNLGPSVGTGVETKLTYPVNFAVSGMSPSCTASTTEANTLDCQALATYSVGGEATFSVSGRFTSSTPGLFTGAIKPGSTTPTDPDSTNNSDSRTITPTQCADGTDNDGDGQIDLADSGCTAASDTTEN